MIEFFVQTCEKLLSYLASNATKIHAMEVGRPKIQKEEKDENVPFPWCINKLVQMPCSSSLAIELKQMEEHLTVLIHITGVQKRPL